MCVVPQAKKPDTKTSSPTPAMSSVLGVSDITQGAGPNVKTTTLDDTSIAGLRRLVTAGGTIGTLAGKALTQQGVSTSTPNAATTSAIDSLPDPAALFAPRILGPTIGPAQLKIPTPASTP